MRVGEFDIVDMLSNTLGHINVDLFRNMLKRLNKNVHRNSYFLVDYRDVVKLLFEKKWLDKMIIKRENKPTLLSITIGCDTVTGEILKQTLAGNRPLLNFTHAIWSPFILEAIMKDNGWLLIKRKYTKRWEGFFDVYKKL